MCTGRRDIKRTFYRLSASTPILPAAAVPAVLCRSLPAYLLPAGSATHSRPPRSLLTDAAATMRVELSPRRREAVPVSGGRPGPVRRGREQGPGHGGGVEGVEVVEGACE
jgi:hypothetical protein